MTDEPVITIGGQSSANEAPSRMSLGIWGPAGMGKTTLACTLPGRIALISFDPDGVISIPPSVAEVTKFDLSTKEDSFFSRLNSRDPLGIDRSDVMDAFDSFVVDSLTTITERTLAVGIGLTKGATIERPSPGAYGARNALAINLIRNVLQITGKHNKHVCFVAHEGSAEKNDEGNVIGIPMALGGQMPSQVALRLNEVWPMFEDGKNRKMIICRKSRMREPAKSRMFNVTNQTEFEWKFDPTDWYNKDNMRIDKWFEQWKANKYEKIPMPK